MTYSEVLGRLVVLYGETSAGDFLAQLLSVHIKISLLLLASLLVLKIWRGSAANRHLLMAGSLAAALLLPIASVLLPSLPLVFEVEATKAAALPIVPETFATEIVAARDWSWNEISELLLLIYLVVTGFLVLRIVIGNLLARHLVATATPVSSASKWPAALVAVQQQLGIRCSIDLRSSGVINSPMTWGFFRPRVVIPVATLDWSEREIRSTLLHELAHIRRGDWLLQQGGRLICAIYWANPLAWLCLRLLANNAEAASDDVALSAGIKRSHYAKILLRIAERSLQRNTQTAATLAMARAHQRSQLGRRVAAILNPVVTHRPNSPWRILSTLGLVGVLLVPVASLRAVYVVVSPAIEARALVTQENDDANNSQEQSAEEISSSEAVTLYEPLSYGEFRQIALADIRRSLGKLSLAGIGVAEPEAKQKAKPHNPPPVAVETGKRRAAEIAKNEIDKVVEANQSEKNVGAIEPVPMDVDAEALAIKTDASQTRLEAAAAGSPLQRLLAMHQQAQLAATSHQAQLSLEQLSRERLVMPVYPRRARSEGIEGEVRVRYNVGSDGRVYSAEVIDAYPKGVFEANVLRAVRRFEFDPHRVQGQAVAVEGVEEKFVFVLES